MIEAVYYDGCDLLHCYPLFFYNKPEPFVPNNSKNHIVITTRKKFAVIDKEEFTELYIPEDAFSDGRTSI